MQSWPVAPSIFSCVGSRQQCPSRAWLWNRGWVGYANTYADTNTGANGTRCIWVRAHRTPLTIEVYTGPLSPNKNWNNDLTLVVFPFLSFFSLSQGDFLISPISFIGMQTTRECFSAAVFGFVSWWLQKPRGRGEHRWTYLPHLWLCSAQFAAEKRRRRRRRNALPNFTPQRRTLPFQTIRHISDHPSFGGCVSLTQV